MLEKPDLQAETILACVQAEYGLAAAQVEFLPLGADLNTAVYRVVTENDTPYFLKLRGGVFDETSVELPKFLADQGIRQVIAPLATQAGRLWANLDAYKTILYPFIEGRNGYEVNLTDRIWAVFGAALKAIHTTVLPPALARRISREAYSPQGRETVKAFLDRVEVEPFEEPVAVNMAAFLQSRRTEILDLVGYAERRARALQGRSPQFVLCHSDVHAGHILIGANDAFYIVDWDNPILALKERDLMFAGGGQGFLGHTAQEEETLFYRGYGPTRVDPVALSYYRYERIIQDIAVFCEQIFLTDEGGEDRERAFHYLKSNFQPNGTIEIARRADRTQGTG